MANKDFRYRISWVVFVPLVFAGIAFLSSLLTFHLAQHDHVLGPNDILQAHLWALLCALVGFLFGLLVTHRLLRPVRRFMKRNRDMLIISQPQDKLCHPRQFSEINYFKRVFARVEDILTQCDARQRFPEIIGDSRVMRGLLRRLQAVAATDATILILGESGTGKERVAASIHKNSRRRKNPFVKLNCVAMPPDLLESALFGHGKDTPDATTHKPGKFALAHGGTIFIDEIGNMPLGLQARILRVIQKKEFDRVGDTRTVQVDVRLICATSKDLTQMVKEEAFREDLYDRINPVSLHLPALRKRKEDILLLVDDVLARTTPATQVSSSALQMMIGYDWPGNVRELQNTVEGAAALSQDQEIAVTHLPKSITGEFNHPFIGSEDENTLSIDDQLKNIEKGMIIEALKKTNGIQIRAAELLGINQRSLWHRIKKYQLDVTAFKSTNE